MSFSSQAVRGLLLATLLFNNAFAQTEELTQPCTAIVQDVADSSSSLYCKTPHMLRYKIPSVSSDWIMEKKKAGELVSGKTTLELPEKTMIDVASATLILEDPPVLVNVPSEDDKEEGGRRKLWCNYEGAVLVVKVNLLDDAPTMSEEEISDAVFGTFGDQVNLSSQMSACTQGDITLFPAGTGQVDNCCEQVASAADDATRRKLQGCCNCCEQVAFAADDATRRKLQGCCEVQVVTVDSIADIGSVASIAEAQETVPGVVTVNADAYQRQGYDRIFNAAITALLDKYGCTECYTCEGAGCGELCETCDFFFDGVDHIMFVFPEDLREPIGEANSPLAFRAEESGPFSVFNDEWIRSVSLQMQAIGFNLGAVSADTPKFRFGDRIGVMGASYSESDTRMCFNAPNAYTLGLWDFETYIPGASKCLKCAIAGGAEDGGGRDLLESSPYHLYRTIDGFSNTPEVIRIPQTSDIGRPLPDFYVSFNAANGINSDTQEAVNQVAVHEAIPWAFSELKATLSEGECYTMKSDRTRGFNRDKDSELVLCVDSIYSGSADVSIDFYTPGNPEFCAYRASKCDCMEQAPGRFWQNEISYVNCVKRQIRSFDCDLDQVLDENACLPFPFQPSCETVASDCSCDGPRGPGGRPWSNDMQWVRCVSTKIRRERKYCDLDETVTNSNSTCFDISPTYPTCPDIVLSACDGVPSAKLVNCAKAALRRSGKYCPLEETLSNLYEQ